MTLFWLSEKAFYRGCLTIEALFSSSTLWTDLKEALGRARANVWDGSAYCCGVSQLPLPITTKFYYENFLLNYHHKFLAGILLCIYTSKRTSTHMFILYFSQTQRLLQTPCNLEIHFAPLIRALSAKSVSLTKVSINCHLPATFTLGAW